MRKFAFILLLIIVIVLLAPFTLGKYLQYDIQNQLKSANLPNGVQIELTHYQTGWLSSQATFKVTTIIPKFYRQYVKLNLNQPQLDDTQTFIINAKITNGPILFSKNLTPNRQWYFGKGLLKCSIQGFKAPITITTLLKFNNALQTKVDLTKLDYADKAKQVYFEMGDSTVYMNANASWNHFDTQAQISFMSYINKSNQLYMKDIHTQSSLTKTDDNVWLSNRSTTLPLIIFSRDKKAVFNIENFQVNIQQQYADKHISSKMNITLQNILYDDNQSIGPASLQMTVKNIDPVAANQLKVISQKKGNKLDSEWKQAFAHFLKGIQIELTQGQITTPKGPINFSGMVQFPPTLPATNSKLFMLQLIKNAHSQYTIGVSQKTLTDLLSENTKDMKDISDTIKTLMQNGYIKNDNGNLSTTFEYQKGKILINGLPPTKITMGPGPVIVQPKPQSTK